MAPSPVWNRSGRSDQRFFDKARLSAEDKWITVSLSQDRRRRVLGSARITSGFPSASLFLYPTLPVRTAMREVATVAIEKGPLA